MLHLKINLNIHPPNSGLYRIYTSILYSSQNPSSGCEFTEQSISLQYIMVLNIWQLKYEYYLLENNHLTQVSTHTHTGHFLYKTSKCMFSPASYSPSGYNLAMTQAEHLTDLPQVSSPCPIFSGAG